MLSTTFDRLRRIAYTGDAATDPYRFALTENIEVYGSHCGMVFNVSVLQAVTQIQEQTLSFVPKIIGMVVVAILFMPWLVVKLLEFSAEMFGPMPAGT